MPSLLPGFEYDVFISYRQNDNRSGWVTQFVEDLREELAATIKEPVNIYFDENPHDGLQATHHVDKSLEGKLRCLVFLPVLSHTYCDEKSFAWNNEFLAFCNLIRGGDHGMEIRLPNGNYASRILPVQVHDINPRDQQLFEQASGSPIRSIDFIFRSSGVNRPLMREDARTENLEKTVYRDQLNKIANAIEERVNALVQPVAAAPVTENTGGKLSGRRVTGTFWEELLRRNVFRAAFMYLIVSLLVIQTTLALTPVLKIEETTVRIITIMLTAGFPLAIWLAWRYEASPQGFIKTTSEASAENPYPPSRKKPLTSGPMVFVLVSSLTLLAIYTKKVIYPDPSTPGNLIAVAVLPFENRSGNNADKYVADAITDDIINRLTATNKLMVRSRGSTQTYTGQLIVFEELVENLEVAFVVKGSVTRVADAIHVTAQLIDKTGVYKWGDTFKHQAGDLMRFQSEIAYRIVNKLQLELNDLELEILNDPPTENATAYDAYIRGRSLYYKRNAAANDSAIVEFRKAIQLDRNYASAWAGLGDALAQRHGRFRQPYSWTDSALVASQRAIDLDPKSAEGYKAKAVAYAYRKDYDKAIELLHKAVGISPTYVQAVGNLGTNYLSKRDLPNALTWEMRSAGLDPSNWIPYMIIGWTYRLLGDLPQAESWLRRSLEKPGGRNQFDTYEHLGYCLVGQRRAGEALKLIGELLDGHEKDFEALEAAGLIAHFAGDAGKAETYFTESIRLNPNFKDDRNTYCPIGLGQILTDKGYKVEADVYLTRAMNDLNAEIAAGSQSVDLPYYMASVHAIRGNKAGALEWLQKAIDVKWVDHAMIEFGPYFVKYRNDPAFQEIVRQLKIKTAAELRKTK